MAQVEDSSEGVAIESIFAEPLEGRPSIIQKHCFRALKEKHEECLWLCTKRRGHIFAKDIPILVNDEYQITLFDLRRQCSWWNRYSLYSAKGVKEVMIRFVGFDEATNRISAVTKSFDYDRSIKLMDRRIAKAWDSEAEPEAEPGECGVDIMGKGHGDDAPCANQGLDNTLTPFCRAQKIRDLEAQRDENQWLSSMLEHFWRNGIGSEGFDFLKKTNFITSYRNLSMETFHDAACPFGKTVYGFELLEGWRIRYLLCLVAASLVASICVTAVGWLYGGSMGAGLTAGTYAITVTAIPLGVLTFLSAVM